MSKVTREEMQSFHAADAHNAPSALRFVAVEVNEQPAGGWYREINDEIEILSRAQLERVSLSNESNAEQTARERIAEIIANSSKNRPESTSK